jgi:transposase
LDTLVPDTPNPKRRRRFSTEFKEAVVAATFEPGRSVAGVAQRYALNANLVHKWRRQRRGVNPPDFIRLPAPVAAVGTSTIPAQSASMVRIELAGGIVAHWPLDRIGDSVPWLKALAY